jgi:hypothetical protein
VRFGNPEYARLVDELNGMKPETRPHRKGAADPKAAEYDWMPELSSSATHSDAVTTNHV